MAIQTRRDRNGRYLNPDPTPHVGEVRTSDFVRWAVRERRRARRAHLARGERLPGMAPRADVALRAATEGVHATWVGHSSFVLRIDGRTFLLDPVWSRKVGWGGMGVRRLTPPGVAWASLPPVDAVLLSHNHYDHLDVPTLLRLPRETPVLCPQGVGRLVRGLGLSAVTERVWWESASLDGARFTLVPAQHFSRRGLLDEDRTLWGGWVVEAGGHRVYFAGDTGWMSTGFAEIGARFPGLDAALVPIGAYLPRWFMRPVHVDPAEAGGAWLETGARLLVPMHWGTFRLADEAMDQPPQDLLRWAHEAGVDAARLRLPALGETLDLTPRR